MNQASGEKTEGQSLDPMATADALEAAMTYIEDFIDDEGHFRFDNESEGYAALQEAAKATIAFLRSPARRAEPNWVGIEVAKTWPLGTPFIARWENTPIGKESVAAFIFKSRVQYVDPHTFSKFGDDWKDIDVFLRLDQTESPNA